MILSALDQLLSNPLAGLITLTTFSIALLCGLVFHELSHAVLATLLGDPTPRNVGRLSLNPLPHMDPLGTTMIFLVGFGWAKPVPVNPVNLRTGKRTGMAVVAAAGPFANILMATIVAIPLNTGFIDKKSVGFTLFHEQSTDLASYIIGSVIFWNLLLASFNLIPIPPLDGFKMALGAMPRETANAFARVERFGPGILLFLVASSAVIPGDSLFALVIRPILNTLSTLVLGGHLW